jgi:hypothetical protein
MSSRNRFLIFTIGLMVVFNLAIAFDVLGNGNAELFAEGAFIEDISFFSFLCGALTLFASACYRSGFDRYLTLVFATTCLLLFLREVEIEELNIPFPIKEIFSDTAKDLLFGIIYLGFIVTFFTRYRHQLRATPRLLRSSVAIWVLVGCVVCVIGSAFEDLDRVFVEELLESNGAFLILVGALLHIFEPGNLTARITEKSR